MRRCATSGPSAAASRTPIPPPTGLRSCSRWMLPSIAGQRGERTLKVEQLIVGPLTTALQPGELLSQVRIPLPPARTAGAYEKLPNPASRFALVGVAAEVSLDAKGAVQWSRIAITG